MMALGPGFAAEGALLAVLAAMLSPYPERPRAARLMDQLDAPSAETDPDRSSDIARLNRIGGTQTIRRHVAPFWPACAPGETLRILDIGTGAADIPLALATMGAAPWPARRRSSLLEMHPTIWRHAAHAARDTPEVRIVARERSRATDPAPLDRTWRSARSSSITSPEEAVVALLRQLAALVRLGFVISDFRRGRIAWAAVWLVTHATACGSHGAPRRARSRSDGRTRRRSSTAWRSAPVCRTFAGS